VRSDNGRLCCGEGEIFSNRKWLTCVADSGRFVVSVSPSTTEEAGAFETGTESGRERSDFFTCKCSAEPALLNVVSFSKLFSAGPFFHFVFSPFISIAGATFIRSSSSLNDGLFCTSVDSKTRFLSLEKADFNFSFVLNEISEGFGDFLGEDTHKDGEGPDGRGSAPRFLVFFIKSCLEVGGGGSGVASARRGKRADSTR
jgi:hypothetical protein